MSGSNNHGGKKPGAGYGYGYGHGHGHGYGYGYPGPRIRLRVVDQYGTEVFFTMKKNEKLKKLLNAFCDRQFVDFNSTSFFFDERSIRGEQTPYELQMEEGDIISAILHRSEEHRVQYDQKAAIILSMQEELFRLRNNLKKFATVDAPKSSKEMSILNMFADASTDAIKYQSRSLSKGPIVADDAFLCRASHHSILGTPVSGKEGVFAPPVCGVCGIEAVVGNASNNTPIDKRLKRKVVSFQGYPSKRTQSVEHARQTEDVSGFKRFVDDSKADLGKSGGSHHHGDGLSLGDLKFVSSRVTCPFVCRELVCGVLSPAKKLDTVGGVVKDSIVKIYEHFANVGSLLPGVMNKVQSLWGQSEGAQKKSSIFNGTVNEEHIVDKVMEKNVTEEPVEGGPTSMEKVVSVEKSVKKAGEVFRGREAPVTPLSDVPIGRGGDGEDAPRNSVGGGDGDPMDSINLFQDVDASQGGGVLP